MEGQNWNKLFPSFRKRNVELLNINEVRRKFQKIMLNSPQNQHSFLDWIHRKNDYIGDLGSIPVVRARPKHSKGLKRKMVSSLLTACLSDFNLYSIFCVVLPSHCMFEKWKFLIKTSSVILVSRSRHMVSLYNNILDLTRRKIQKCFLTLVFNTEI